MQSYFAMGGSIKKYLLKKSSPSEKKCYDELKKHHEIKNMYNFLLCCRHECVSMRSKVCKSVYLDHLHHFLLPYETKEKQPKTKKEAIALKCHRLQ